MRFVELATRELLGAREIIVLYRTALQEPLEFDRDKFKMVTQTEIKGCEFRYFGTLEGRYHFVCCSHSARHAVLVCHACATSMTSVRPFVTLLDCHHIAQQKVEMAYGRIDRCFGCPHAKADPDRNILRSEILLRKTSGVCKNVQFCSSASVP